MKVGFLGGIILLILTLVFSVIAIQNNKLARTIVVAEFNKSEQPSTSDKDFDKGFEKFNSNFEKASKNFNSNFDTLKGDKK